MVRETERILVHRVAADRVHRDPLSAGFAAPPAEAPSR